MSGIFFAIATESSHMSLSCRQRDHALPLDENERYESANAKQKTASSKMPKSGCVAFFHVKQ